MKRTIYILMICAIAAGALTAGSGRAEAMNNEAAALLAGGIALFGGAVIHAALTPEPVYAEAYPPVHYRYYRPVRTEVVYVAPAHRHYRHCGHEYDRGWRHDHRRHGWDRY